MAEVGLESRKKYAAEILGTFCLIFAGTGAIVINDVSGGTVTHVGVALTFGLVVMAMIYALGEVSGAHLNPAVTLGFWIAGRFPGRSVMPYLASQLVGALLASGLLWGLFPTHERLGSTLPAGSAVQSCVLETVLTAMLMFVILAVSSGAKEKGLTAGIAIGGVIALEALFAGPVCGASMNPVRSLAPAVVSAISQQLQSDPAGSTLGWDAVATHAPLRHLWVYFAGPLSGAAMGVFCCRAVYPLEQR